MLPRSSESRTAWDVIADFRQFAVGAVAHQGVVGVVQHIVEALGGVRVKLDVALGRGGDLAPELVQLGGFALHLAQQLAVALEGVFEVFEIGAVATAATVKTLDQQRADGGQALAEFKRVAG